MNSRFSAFEISYVARNTVGSNVTGMTFFRWRSSVIATEKIDGGRMSIDVFSKSQAPYFIFR